MYYHTFPINGETRACGRVPFHLLLVRILSLSAGVEQREVGVVDIICRNANNAFENL